VGQRKHKFNHIRQVAPMCPHGRTHWRHLANTIEPSVCCGDAALCQITLTTCCYYYNQMVKIPGLKTKKNNRLCVELTFMEMFHGRGLSWNVGSTLIRWSKNCTTTAGGFAAADTAVGVISRSFSQSHSVLWQCWSQKGHPACSWLLQLLLY